MWRSVRIRLILNNVLISLIAILAVGLFTLALVNRYFGTQETQYLQDRANAVKGIFVPLLSATDPSDADNLVALTAFFSDVRIQLLDPSGSIVADSGPRDPNRPFIPGSGSVDAGNFNIEFGDDGSISLTRRNMSFLQRSGFETDSGLIFSAETPITSISDTSLTVSLAYGNQTVGFLQLSEGPAAGQGIRGSIQSALLIGSAAALFVAILVGLITAGQIVRPLSQLEKAAGQMANRNLDARAPAAKLTEFNQLANQFNDMADQLTNTIGRLESERAVLRRMIADASHELRTPLTALKTFNTLLVDEVSSAQALQFVDESSRQIDQLDRLTTGLLDLSRLEARISGTEFISADFCDTVRQTLEGLEPIFMAKSQTISLNMPQFPVIFKHDQEAMQQAIGNVVINASKYSPKETTITLNLELFENIALHIFDEGPGIAEDVLPHIFNRFYRDPSQRNEGTGLGLAISHEIVKIHDGTISAHNRQMGGACFAIEFPKSLLAESVG